MANPHNSLMEGMVLMTVSVFAYISKVTLSEIASIISITGGVLFAVVQILHILKHFKQRRNDRISKKTQ